MWILLQRSYGLFLRKWLPLDLPAHTAPMTDHAQEDPLAAAVTP